MISTLTKSLKHLVITTISALLVSTSVAQERSLQLDEIWGSPKLYARIAGGFNTLPDGQHYSNAEVKEDGSYLLKYSLKSGKVIDTLIRPKDLISNGDTVEYSDYSFSNDASKILLKVKPEAIYRHSTREEYYVFERSTKNLKRITQNGKSMYGTFSPDGKQLAYVRDNNLYLYNLLSDKEIPVTVDGKKNQIINGATDWVYEEEFSMDIAFSWSPDGKKIAFYRFDESNVKEFNLTFYGELYPKEERYKYPKAGEENSKVEIVVYDIASGKKTEVFSTDNTWEYIPRMKWTKDPDVLSIQRTNRHQNILELVLYSVTSNTLQVILKEENKSFIEITDDLTFLNDGKRFVWTSTRNGFNHIYLYGIDGKVVKQVTDGNFDVTKYYGFDEKTQSFFFQSAEKSPLERHLYAVNMKGKKSLLSPSTGTHTIEFTAGLNYYVDTYSSFGKPYTCSLNDNQGQFLRVLEENTETKKNLSGYRMGKIDTLSFRTDDGIQLYGWIIYPTDFNPAKKYPVLMHIYGGPGVQTVTDDWDGPNYLWHQLLAQRGYIIVSFDNRGTPGRGLEFANCIYKDMGNLEVQDQLSAFNFMKKKPFVDGDRIGVWGWSFGGYMTSLLLTKGAGAFKMGIAVAPVTTWRYYDSIYTERYLQTPQENPKGYDDNSPINFAKNLKGKFLLVHGSTDDNVHMQNTMDFTTALVKANKQFDLFIYPNKNHGISGGTTRLNLYTKMTNFVLENL
ncbi:MAG: S9 family peptidase [Bacteroidetes bacterium]|nr:S9 family peptidase [Bacteroidota bacterium]